VAAYGSKFHKLINYLIFEQVSTETESREVTRNLTQEVSTQKLVTKLSEIWVRSEIRDQEKLISDPGSRG
jgi:hypothetical protein